MAKDAREYGPTAQRVAANVRTLREARGWSLGALSTRLTDLGQPIGIGVLSKLELGQRRVDVDDLTALAVALDVAPSRLLLSAGADVAEQVALTPGLSVSEAEAWAWAAGDSPLSDKGGVFDLDRVERFAGESRPHDVRDHTTVGELVERRADLARLLEGYRHARAAGVPHGALIGYLDLMETVAGLGDALTEERGQTDGQR